MEARPFALIGVNINDREVENLKEIMETEKLNWRSFVQRADINASWNNPGTPTYYVLDHKGVIQHKWFGYPGEKALDTALDALIEGVEGEARKLPQ